MHHLTVEGFLGIKRATVELNGLTVLIGAQASGKSVIARLIYFFNEYFADFDITEISNNEHKKSYDRKKKEEFYKIFPQHSWESGAFHIVYSNMEHNVQINSSKNSSVIDIQTSASVASYFRALKSTYKKFEELEGEEESNLRYRLRFEFREFLNHSDLAHYESALFVPAARSFYATIRDEIFSLLALDEKIDHIILKFGEFYETAKRRALLPSTMRSSIQRSGYFKRIVKGNLVRESGQYLLVMDHGRIELSKASSGQQEAIPLLLSISQFTRTGKTLIIEEPEAHLFPEAQVEVLDFMVGQLRRWDANIMFTTHSPYLLSSLNNHILAFDKHSKSGISIDRVRAYSIEKGVSMSLLDEEIGLISGDYIDSVSESIERKFSELVED